MTKIIVLCDILLVLLDIVAIFSLRDFLLDFLIGARNRKSARAIYAQQLLKDRILLCFIKTFIKKHILAFKVYNWIYLTELATLIPQYVILITANILYGIQSKYLIFSLIGIKGLLCLIIRFQVDSLMRSRYRNGK